MVGRDVVSETLTLGSWEPQQHHGRETRGTKGSKGGGDDGTGETLILRGTRLYCSRCTHCVSVRRASRDQQKNEESHSGGEDG